MGHKDKLNNKGDKNKDLLLNIFGSMPPKENKPMKWSDIRKMQDKNH